MISAQGQKAGRRRKVRGNRVQKRGAALVAALISCLLAISVAMPIPSLGGSSIAVAAIQRAKSLVELMHQRSPGKRLVAHLAQTKHRKLAAHERALPKIRKRSPKQIAMPALPTELPPALIDLVAPATPVEMASLEAVPVGPFAQQVLWPAPSGPPGGYILPPTETPGTPVTPQGPGKTPVPEPATWMMMLLGFTLMGWGLRSRSNPEQIAT